MLNRIDSCREKNQRRLCCYLNMLGRHFGTSFLRVLCSILVAVPFLCPKIQNLHLKKNNKNGFATLRQVCFFEDCSQLDNTRK